MLKKIARSASLIALATAFYASPALASDPQLAEVLKRLQALEAANAILEAQLAAIQNDPTVQQVPLRVSETASANQTSTITDSPPTESWTNGSRKNLVGTNAAYSDDILEHTEGVNQRLLMQLRARQDKSLNDAVTFSGRVIAIANAHHSNRPNKFGYLMRHPTGNNQRTQDTQEIAVSSAQLAVTFTPHSDFTGYVELLYDPEQSFGAGTLTTLARNQVQVRKAHVMWGNLNKLPVYAAMGKMDVPFGLQDSVSPFTNSTNWHAFAPLAYGGQLGFYKYGLSLRAMAVLGGAQFRSANTPVDGTAIPSKLNNYAFDGSYSLGFGKNSSIMVGGSYIRGSAYCQAYPIFHFNPCPEAVPAWAAYGRVDYGRLRLLGEFAQTTKVWPGTKVPDPTNPLSQFEASDVISFTAGARYNAPVTPEGFDVSLEYSKFIAGPEGSPWNRQDQLVVGLSDKITDGVSLFGEFIKVKGFAPLNFLSGGNFADGSTWSDKDARSRVFMLGVKAGF